MRDFSPAQTSSSARPVAKTPSKKKRLKLTVVIVSHDVGVVSSHVDKVACLNRTLYLHDTPDKMFNNKTLEKVYGCEIGLVAHGKYPHRVLEEHS